MSGTRGRPFAPGNKMGKGRPRGSRNRSVSPGQDLLRHYEPQIVGKCITMAMNGDRSAMRCCMERISPARRDPSVRLNLPAIRTVEDLEKAAGKVTQSIGRGTITPTDGEKLMNVLESHSKIIETSQVEARIASLEDALAESGSDTDDEESQK